MPSSPLFAFIFAEPPPGRPASPVHLRHFTPTLCLRRRAAAVPLQMQTHLSKHMKDPKLMCAVEEAPVEDDDDEDEDDSEEPASKKRKKSKKTKKEKKSKKTKKEKKSSSSSKKGAIVKGATSSFMYFSKDARPLVKEENPEMAFGDIAKAIGAKWKGLSDKEKKPFDALAAEDKARYNAEIKAGGVKASSVKKAKGAGGGTGGGFQAPVALSKELGAFLKAKQMPRTEVTKQMWVYIKEHELQDPNNKKQIICDDALKKVRVRGCVWGGGNGT